MKNILTITLIIVLLIGIYTYAHINRYDVHTTDTRGAETIVYVLDKWTGKAHLTAIDLRFKGTWLDLGKP